MGQILNKYTKNNEEIQKKRFKKYRRIIGKIWKKY